MPLTHRSWRLLRHALLLLVSSVLAAWLGSQVAGDYLSVNLSVGFAYASLVFFSIALSLGPYRAIRAQPAGVSSYLRRDIGIWAGIMAVSHTLFSLQHHVGGRIAGYFFATSEPHLLFFRADAFGISNWIALAGLFGILLLLGLSNDWSLKRFGPARWKRLQRGAYGIGIATVLHGSLVHLRSDRSRLLLGVFLIATAATLALQLAGYLSIRKTRGAGSRPGI